MGQIYQLIQQFAYKGVAILVFSLGHGDGIIVVEFFKANSFGYIVDLLHVSIGIDQFLELLVKHLEAVNVDKVLDILQT